MTVPLTIEAGTAASTTTLTLGQTSFVAGAPGTVKATATVTSDAAASGTVEFVVDGTVVATATVGGGSASAQLALPGSLTTGTHQVIARYLGSDTVSASESASVAVTLIGRGTDPPALTVMALLPSVSVGASAAGPMLISDTEVCHQPLVTFSFEIQNPLGLFGSAIAVELMPQR